MPRSSLAHFVRSSLQFVFVLVCFASIARANASDSAAGRWKGAIDVPGAKLAVDIRLIETSAAWTGTITIPDQHAKDLPLEKIDIQKDVVTFAIAGVPGEPMFHGKLASDGAKLAGDFTQGGATMTFALERSKPAEDALSALKGFDEWLDAAREAWKVPGVAVAIVHGGETVYAKGFGLRDVDAKLPVTPDTLFAIGSSTKAFTTFVLATLADEGKLEWDVPVRRYIPEFRLHDPMASERITARDLVTHRSGLPRHDALWYNSPLSRADMVRRIQYLPESKDFRTEFQYNNLMFMTAGYLAERISGTSWEDLVRTRIFQPLAMSRSNFSVIESARDADHAEPYEERDKKIEHMKFRDITNVGPAGAINSSVNEMARWVALHMSDGEWKGKRLIQQSSLEDLHTMRMPMGGPNAATPEIVPVGYALGWMVDIWRGHLRVRHGGAIDGFLALVAMLPEDDWGFVVLSNKSANPLPELVVQHAADRVLDLSFKDWSAQALARHDKGLKSAEEAEKKKTIARRSGTTPSHALADFAGEYEHPGYGVIRVDLANDKLGVEFNRIHSPLEHWHYDVFNVAKTEGDHTLEDTKIQFLTGMDGDIDALRAAVEPALEEAVFKRLPDARLHDASYLARFEGRYKIDQEIASIVLKGGTLTAIVPGQPPYSLEPRRNDTFGLKGLTGYSLRFVSETDGKVNSAEFIQPNGVFAAQRVN
jgi:CubicO group peptidase (beta-lactamase class C family)